MKRLFFLFAAALALASCDHEEPDGWVKMREPSDMNGTYNVEYKVYIDGKSASPINTDPFRGRIEVYDAPDHHGMGIHFFPEGYLLRSNWIDRDTNEMYFPMWPLNTKGTAGNYTFDCDGTAELYVSESHATVGSLIMSGSIVAKTPAEIDNLDSSVMLAAVMGDYNLYHNVALTVNIRVPDPDVPSGTVINEETGYGIHKIRIEIMSVDHRNGYGYYGGYSK